MPTYNLNSLYTGIPYIDFMISSISRLKPFVDFVAKNWVIILIFFGVLIALSTLAAAADYIFGALGIRKMAQNAGFRFSWFAFVPNLRECVIFKLPKKNFEIGGLVNMQSRMKAFITFLVLTYVMPSVVNTVISVMGIFFSPLYLLVIPAGFFFMIAVNLYLAVSKYDLLITFNVKKGTAVIISILSVFCPLVFSLYAFAIRKNEPIHGLDYYYSINPEDYDDNDEYSR